MNISAASGAGIVGQAQVIMMRKAMDMALENNTKMLSALPPPPSSGQGGGVDIRV